MLKKFIAEKHFVGLDIGSQGIKAALIRLNEANQPQLLGVYEVKTSGFRRGSVSDIGELTESVNATINGLSQNTGIKIKEIILGIDGNLIEKRLSNAIIPLTDRGNKVVTSQDIKKVHYQARLLGVNMEEVVIHDFPQYYKVDDVNMALNPAGLYARKLEVQSLLLVSKNTLIKNLTKAINQAGFDVMELSLSSIASTEVALNPEQKKEGVVLVDIGSGLTDIAIFKDGLLRYLENITIGGENVTRAIAEKLDLAFDLAEDIKQSYATTGAEANHEEEILVKRDDGYVPIKKEIICQAIEPVVDEIVRSILDSIKRSGLYEQINVGMIMVGGGALLPGLIERIEATSNLPAKMGRVALTQDKIHHASKFASAIGLAQIGINKSKTFTSGSNGHPTNWRTFVASRVKELYQEYF
jgi:cell division protein FtsA